MADTQVEDDSYTTVIVIGVSAGGMDALTRLVVQLPEGFGAPVFIVQHMAPDTTGGALLRSLREQCKLPCSRAQDGEPFETGHVYLSPSDHHMMIGGGKILITKGAHENRSRPAIDPLFRSAAVGYRNRVIGVLLTGYLDDGTAGLMAIKRCGGICVVQDPADAAYPDMPQNALNQVEVDHCLPLSEMGTLFCRLLQRELGAPGMVPESIAIEARIAARVLSDLPSVHALGQQVPFNCPGCGGVLWQIEDTDALRFRCHTGHAYTAPVLLAEQSSKIEETLWVALRMFEERRNLLMAMSKKPGQGGSRSVRERAERSEVHIERIRSMLRADDQSPSDGASL